MILYSPCSPRPAVWPIQGATTALFAAAWLIGLPLPHVDDLFFVGPALHLVSEGSLANPLIRLWHPAAAVSFLLQPPFYPRLLAGWLTLTGISGEALRAFQCLCLAGTSIAAQALGVRLGFRPSLLVPAAFLVPLATSGLRHDALGLALLAIGALCVSYRGGCARFAAGFFLACAGGTWPVLAAFSLPLIVWMLFAGRSLGWPTVLALPAGVLAAMWVGIAALDSTISAFVHEFTWLAGLANGRASRMQGLQHQLTVGWNEWTVGLPLTITVVVLALSWWRVRETRPIVAATVAGLGLVVALYPFALVSAALLVAGIVMVFLSQRVLPRYGVVAATCAISCRLLLPAVQTAAHLPMPREALPPLAFSEQEILMVDEYSARLGYDYRLPSNAIDWNWSRATGPHWPTDVTEAKPGELWYVSEAQRTKCGGLGERTPFRCCGLSFGSIPSDPWKLLVWRSATPAGV
jgi:hypothetical protein